MPLSKSEWLALEKKAYELRKLTVQTTVWAGSGHFGGGMSVMDLLTVLYHKYLNIKVEEPQWEDRDRFILSKGHAAIAYAPVLCDKGFNDVEMLKSFNLPELYAIPEIYNARETASFYKDVEAVQLKYKQ